MQMEQFVNFLQHELEKDFGLEDDAVVLELNVSLQSPLWYLTLQVNSLCAGKGWEQSLAILIAIFLTF